MSDRVIASLAAALFTVTGCVTEIGPSDGPSLSVTSERLSSSDARERLRTLLEQTSRSDRLITGQHSMFWDAPSNVWFPTTRDTHVLRVAGDLPGLFSSDFGDFAGSTVPQRGRVADMALAYASAGSLIQLSYHLCQPDEANGCGFETMHQFSASNPYPSWKIDEILRPGSAMNLEHIRRLDEVAGYLKRLRDAGVPVLWRPFHEMNGTWFWWCQQDRYVDLWRQMHDRFTRHHGLDNLLWVFSVNSWARTWGEAPDVYYPGHDVVDVVGVDVYTEYGHEYSQGMHDHLLRLAGGKPLAITENGAMPNWAQIRSTQSGYAYFVTWAGFEQAPNNPSSRYDATYGQPGVLTLDDIDLEADGATPTEPAPDEPGTGGGHPACRSAASDPDGDGWGWENERSCRVTTESTSGMTASGHPVCRSAASDPDGDGWGWENARSCRVTSESMPVTTASGHPVCRSAASDPDGDGWGWENERSCRVVD